MTCANLSCQSLRTAPRRFNDRVVSRSTFTGLFCFIVELVNVNQEAMKYITPRWPKF